MAEVRGLYGSESILELILDPDADGLESVTIHIYESETEARTRADSMPPEDPYPTADLLTPVTCWRLKNSIVAYYGWEEEIAEALDLVFGPAFAGDLRGISN